MFDKLKKLVDKYRELILFIIFFFFYFSICCYLNENVSISFDYLFESDTPRVVNDFSEIFSDHYRMNVHPLFVLLFQPIIFLMDGIIHNKLLSIIIFSSIIGAFQVLIMYRTLNLVNKIKSISLFVSIIFGLSCSNVIFNSAIELYNLAALSMQLLWYFIIKIIINKEKISKNNFILLLLCGVFCMGVTITNFVVFLICCFILCIVKFKDKSEVKKIISLICCVIMSTVFINGLQKIIYGNFVPFGFSNNDGCYLSFKIGILNLKKVILNGFCFNLLGGNINSYVNSNNNLVLNFGCNFNLLFVFVFYTIIIFYIIKYFRKNKEINIGIILVILFNLVLHLIYGNDNVFLYSQHFNYLIFLLLGINFNVKGKNIKTFNLVLVIVAFYFLINNFIVYEKVLDYSEIYFDYNGFSLLLLIIINIIILLNIFLMLNIFKIIKNRLFINKFNLLNLVSIVCHIYVISLSFIFINVYILYQYNYDVTYFDSIKDKYSWECMQYNNYMVDYINFTSEYDVKLIDIKGGVDYYFFGLGDRKKLMYFDGKIKDIFSGDILYEWDVKEELIIPNIYTVIIETYDGHYIKIYEDESGVHILKENDYIIDGTDIEITLYDFSDYKYGNLLSVLYSEILFNVKDGKIYPNIFVYDNPWYRDAAISAMVLEYTNNIDLVEEWIKSIEQIYDLQNGGIKEVDNLGELLYLKSLVVDKEDAVVKEIIEEANLIRSSSDKNSLYGYTDGSVMSRYQTIWYNFGLKRLDLNNYFDINNISSFDSYSSTTWWNGECNNGKLVALNSFYPYLGWAQYHCVGSGQIYLGKSLYPLSYESYGSQANYNDMYMINEWYVNKKISPVHSWTASEVLMYLISLNEV